MMMLRMVLWILLLLIILVSLARLETFLTMPVRVMHFLPVSRWMFENISVTPLLTLNVLVVTVVWMKSYGQLIIFLKNSLVLFRRLGLMFSRLLVTMVVVVLLLLLIILLLLLQNSLLLFSTIVVNLIAGA